MIASPSAPSSRQRRGRDSLVHVLCARIGAALDAVYVVAHDFATGRAASLRRTARSGREPPAPPRSNASNTMSTKSRSSPLPARRRITADSIADVSSLPSGASARTAAGRGTEVMNEIGGLIPRSVATDCSVIASAVASNRRRATRAPGCALPPCTSHATGIVFFATGFAFATIDTLSVITVICAMSRHARRPHDHAARPGVDRNTRNARWWHGGDPVATAYFTHYRRFLRASVLHRVSAPLPRLGS